MERYFLQVLYDMFQIPMACWDGEASFVQPSSAQPDAPVLGVKNCCGELENICCRNAFPVIYLEDEWIYYGIFRDIGGGLPALARCPSKNEKDGSGGIPEKT